MYIAMQIITQNALFVKSPLLFSFSFDTKILFSFGDFVAFWKYDINVYLFYVQKAPLILPINFMLYIFSRNFCQFFVIIDTLQMQKNVV